MSFADPRLTLLTHQPHVHRHGLSRRQFLGMTAGATGQALGAELIWPRVAHADPPGTGTPNPILGGIKPLAFAPNVVFHVFPPPDTETTPFPEPSTITDFNGFVGISHVSGHGVGITGGGAPDATLTYDIDNRFMTGEFIGADGRHRQGTFAFL
ncbi:MAG TPA: twin-arginine translocation signal domain-containing protein [Dehalococcoidia bacterium]|nr:twin-arginine translocation signal domain-containing protein [Dehalococcoidia bacterium]